MERKRITAEKCPCMKWEEFVIMPDHVHALIRMEGGCQRLGDIVGGFKAAISREWHRHPYAPPRDIRIWHRNYYEMIVRTTEMERNIREYIRMNPWRCVQQFGNGLRGMGNPSLWNRHKVGVLASRGDTSVAQKGEERRGDTCVAQKGEERRGDTCVAQKGEERRGDTGEAKRARQASPVLSGFHSAMEREVFAQLLKAAVPLIWCPAWGLERSASVPGVRAALEQNRLLILEMRNREGNLAAAEQRNRFVLENADQLWLPHIRPGGMLDRLVKEMGVQEKMGNEMFFQ